MVFYPCGKYHNGDKEDGFRASVRACSSCMQEKRVNRAAVVEWSRKK